MSDIFSTLNAKLQEGAKQLRESYVAEDIQQFVEQLKKDTKDYTQQIGKNIDEIKGTSTTDRDMVDVISVNDKYSCLSEDIRTNIREVVNNESTYNEDLESEYQVVDAGECQGVESVWSKDKVVTGMYDKLVTNGNVSSDEFWMRFATKLHYIIQNNTSTAEHTVKESPAIEGRMDKTSTSPEGRLAAAADDEDDEIVWD